MKIGLTGSSSAIGQHLAQSLHSEGHTVVCLGGSKSSIWRLGQPLPANLGINALVHLAHDRKMSLSENVSAAKILCESFDGPKVFLSSFSAHSKSCSRYGKSKFEIESIFQHSLGSSLRAGIVYGQSDGGIYGQLQMLIEKLPVIPIPYNGSPLLFTTHIDDLVEEIISTLFQGAGPTIFAANPKPITLEELILQIKAQMGRSKPRLLLWRQPLDLILKAIILVRPNIQMADSMLSLSNECEYRELSQLKIPTTSFRSFDLNT